MSYYQECMDIAKDIVEEFTQYGGDICDHEHERVDGHQWIIYYAYNDDLLRHCGNADAWEDIYSNEDIGDIVTSQGMNGARTVQAYWAMLEDVSQALHELGAYDL